MADKAQNPSTSTSGPAKPSRGDEKEEGSFARTTLPYVVVALLAAAAMAWYFFVFVPAKIDYFVGLRFRTLAIASGHVASKVDNLARAVASVPKSPDETQNSPCSQPTSSKEKAYIALVVPEIQLSPAGGPAQGPQFPLCDVTASVAWTDVATQAAAASRRDFDDLIIADAAGDVVWQREISTPRIGNLSELLAAPDDSGGWSSLSWRERATMPAKKDPSSLRSSAVLKVVNLGGSSSLLLVQAVSLTDKNIILSGGEAAKAGDRPRLYVAGVLSRAALQQQARRIPAAWIVLIALPIVVLFLAIPFVKLMTLTSKERYRFSDVVLMILATVAAAGLGAMIPFVSSPASAPDKTLKTLAAAVNEGLRNETQNVLSLARDILEHAPKIDSKLTEPCEALPSGLPGTSTPAARTHECGLWEGLEATGTKKVAVDLDVVIWFDESGNQFKKWTTKRQVTGPASHRPFDHYRAVTTDQLWTLNPSPQTPAGEGSTSTLRFMIDPLRAPTTSELGVVFVTPAAMTTEGKPTYLALNVRPQSVVDPPSSLRDTDSPSSPRPEKCCFIPRRG